jgi:multiple sugar transport system substrate-binding protein
MIPQKKPTRSRVLAALGLALALIAALPGCSGLAGLGAEPVELTFVYFENAADYEPLAQSFHEKYPNITIKLDPVTSGPGDSSRAMQTKAETADVIRISSTMLNEATAASFLPLDSYITTDKNFPQGDLISGSLEGLKVGGKQVGLPAALNPYVVFYDPQLFTSRGITPPAAGWTVEDFMTTAMALNHTDQALVGTQEYTFGYCSTPQFFDPVMFAYIFGGGIFDSPTTPTTPT